MIGQGGVPVGLLPRADYETVRFTLATGDRLFLYSDGIPEAETQTAGQIGDDGLIRILKDFHDRPLQGFSDHLLHHLEMRCGRTSHADDVSAICIECQFSCPIPASDVLME